MGFMRQNATYPDQIQRHCRRQRALPILTRCGSLIGLGSGVNNRAMLLLTSVFAALAIATSAGVTAASDDPGGGMVINKRPEGYAMVWRKGKRDGANGSPLYMSQYVLSPPRQLIRELDVTQPYAMYDLDSSLYDDNDDEGGIAALPEGTIEKRAPAYSQWRKNGKRSQIFKDYADKRAYRDWRKGKRSSGFKQWRKMG